MEIRFISLDLYLRNSFLKCSAKKKSLMSRLYLSIRKIKKYSTKKLLISVLLYMMTMGRRCLETSKMVVFWEETHKLNFIMARPLFSNYIRMKQVGILATRRSILWYLLRKKMEHVIQLNLWLSDRSVFWVRSLNDQHCDFI